MGEYPSIQQLDRTAGLLHVINPPMDQRDRSQLVIAPFSPPPEDWRRTMSPRLGGVLDGRANVLRSNHFKINPAQIPFHITLYHVKIYKYERSTAADRNESFTLINNNLVADVKDTDTLITYAVMRAVKNDHPEWQVCPRP